MFWRGWGCSEWGGGCSGGGGGVLSGGGVLEEGVGVRVFWRGRVLHDLLSEND